MVLWSGSGEDVVEGVVVPNGLFLRDLNKKRVQPADVDGWEVGIS